jgi:hypothetical protein
VRVYLCLLLSTLILQELREELDNSLAERLLAVQQCSSEALAAKMQQLRTAVAAEASAAAQSAAAVAAQQREASLDIARFDYEAETELLLQQVY